MNGIKPKIVTRGKQHNEHARRYIWYPLSNLDFAGSQFMSPIWNPKIMRGRIILLESHEYKTQVANEGELMAGSNGVVLGERTMGTDAQVRYLMGNSEGTGWMEKGMTNLDSMIDVDYETAEEIEQAIFPNGIIPPTILDIKAHLENISVIESPISNLVTLVLAEMREGVLRSNNYCLSLSNQLEQELRQGQSGGIGIKSLSETQKYYFHQIKKPLPEDRVGVNMGSEISMALAPLIESMSNKQGITMPLEVQAELEILTKKLDAAEKTIQEQAEVIETVTQTNDTEGTETA